MKIRTGFVTNSSSANFTVELQLKSDRDDMAEFSASTTRDFDWEGHDAYYDGSSLHKELFEGGWHIEALGLNDPYEGFDGSIHLHGCSLSSAQSIEEVIEGMLGLIKVVPYDYGILSDEKFFVVGEPEYYASREDLGRVIQELKGEITGLAEATRVIYCGKERFCERWPPGFSSNDLVGNEEDEYWKMSEAVDDEFKEAALESWDWSKEPDGLFAFIVLTGDATTGMEDFVPDSYDWWGVCSFDNHNWRDPVIPVISEREFAYFDPYGPAGDGTITAMPGAVKTLAEECSEKGITRENLRIIGGKICATPFGDSVWEYDDYTDQWCINVKKGELRSTGMQVTRCAGSLEGRGDIYDVDTSWRDTVWWPFPGM